MIHIESAASTHVGRIREVNQDRALVSGQIAAVADGMGGHAGGDKAAALAIAELSGVRGTISSSRLVKVVQAANKRIYKVGLSPELRGMGTTIVAAVIDNETEVMSIVNVGDSRGYQLRDGVLSQVTEDHSLVEDLLRAGRLTAEEAKVHPKRNIVTRVLGIGEDVDVDVFDVALVPGDRFVLCSDGLTNEVDDDGIVEILDRNPSCADAAEELVTTAVNNGGRDNVTVVVVDVYADGPDVVAQPPTEELTAVATEASDVADVDGLESAEVLESEVSPRADAFPDTDPQALLAEVGLQPDAGLDDDRTTPEITASGVTDSGTTDVGEGNAKDRVSTRATERALPLRLILAAAGAIVILVIALWAIYAHNDSYFAQEVDGEVVILHGRPDGFLWIEPEVVQQTGLQAGGLNGLGLTTLEGRPASSSQAEALAFVEALFNSDTDTDPTAGG